MCEYHHPATTLALPAVDAAIATRAHVRGTNSGAPPATGRCVAMPQALAIDPGLGRWPQPATNHRAGIALPDPQPEPAPHGLGRVRLWELPHKYHCPVIGTCVTVDELRSLARKAGVVQRGKRPSDYEVHVSFVAAADGKNPMSVAVQKALERKFTTAVRRFSRARSPEAVLSLWQAAVADGQVPAALWAVMTHAAADAEVRAQAYEDVL